MTRCVPDATSRTDGDIVLRGVAAGRAPYATTAGRTPSPVVVLEPDDFTDRTTPPTGRPS